MSLASLWRGERRRRRIISGSQEEERVVGWGHRGKERSSERLQRIDLFPRIKRRSSGSQCLSKNLDLGSCETLQDFSFINGRLSHLFCGFGRAFPAPISRETARDIVRIQTAFALSNLYAHVTELPYQQPLRRAWSDQHSLTAGNNVFVVVIR